MELLSQLLIPRPEGDASIQLLYGDLTAIPREFAVDILAVSAFRGEYVPLPGTLIGALDQAGLSVADLALHKEVDLLNQLSCWLSQPLSPAHQVQFNIRKILCFEPKNTLLNLEIGDAIESWTHIRVVRSSDQQSASGNQQPTLLFTMFTHTNLFIDDSLQISDTVLTHIDMLEETLHKGKWSPKLVRTIYEQLIPNDFKAQIKQQNNINWMLDEYTAGFPWELLQDSSTDERPMSVDAVSIRQSTGRHYRPNLNYTLKRTAIVIGDPDLRNPTLALPAAYREGETVTQLLSSQNFNVTSLLGQSAARILQDLFSSDYKIMHFSGHGVVNSDPAQTGLVIGPNAFLTPAYIDQMSSVPELVFVNCCHLGKTDSLAEDYSRSRFQLAANLGTQLIEIGVKAVVVAGWAVNDQAALEFAERFYECLFGGDNFGVAIKKARSTIFENYGPENNAWNAYQCYGDASYTLVNQSQNSAAETEVQNLFRGLNTFAIDDNYNHIAMPVLATGNQQFPVETMLPLLLDTAIFWLENGLPLTSLKLTLFRPEQLEIGRPIFENAKKQYALKTLAETGQISASQSLSEITLINKTAPIECSLPKLAYALQEQAQAELGDSLELFDEETATRGEGILPVPPIKEYDYFISYSHQYTSPVQEFVKALQAHNPQFRIFYDRDSIPTGGLWIKMISDAIQNAKNVICILTPEYSQSPVCWDEFQCAKAKEYRTRQPVIKTINFCNDANMPLILSIYSWIDCTEADLDKLKNAVAQLVAN